MLSQDLRSVAAALSAHDSPARLDAAFHVLADCHGRADTAGFPEALCDLVQGIADAIAVVQQARHTSDQLMALIARSAEDAAVRIAAYEQTTPAPETAPQPERPMCDVVRLIPRGGKHDGRSRPDTR